ncbi:DUF6165 family protein [Thiohalobacter sp. IOR34]|uniref:DUF6165 family protein n=1 Tax=Thiohalobacter sp. IOR34 TaxID=3057176 RepID=UPI0025B21E15|nr:DUF6165 family protein [Thiohalobacter sp. IOR34]WJW75266.1 DUF6165 family protein [Thiohalobacter sp. IOR34]
MSILAPVSVGEFLDKVTILEIKSERIDDPEKLANIRRELDSLRATWAASPYAGADLEPEYSQLKAVNEQLWEIEDDIRDKERTRCFDARFIELARAVYVTNDRRAELKKALNLKLGSELVEEKSYADYQGDDAADR